MGGTNCACSTISRLLVQLRIRAVPDRVLVVVLGVRARLGVPLGVVHRLRNPVCEGAKSELRRVDVQRVQSEM